MRILKLSFISALIIFAHFGASAQSLPVGTTAIEDYYRRSQLLGTADSTVSFTVRPLFPGAIKSGTNAFYPDSPGKKYEGPDLREFRKNNKGELQVSYLPASMQTQFNSHHPYGWNDGIMIPAKGLEVVVSGGLFIKYGMLTVQLKPELLLASNSDFVTLNQNHYDVLFARYYDIYNNIDMPARFGTEAYNVVRWGQSSIRLNYKALSFGLSTENLWWGPGIRNSLLMSNTAPGFLHLTLNTLRPIKTAIGSFEGQLIGGRLTNSGFPPLEPDHYYFGTDLYVPKPTDWRYLAGIVLSWQPKWIPGLFLGFDQSSQTYGKDVNSLKNILPLFVPIKKTSGPNEAINKQDERSEIFMRWLWAEENAEIYFEWGHNNYTSDFSQTSLTPEKSRAYIFGLRKMIPFNTARKENILIGVEVTQLQETSVSKVKKGEEWYTSKAIPAGYTNDGEVLGAGIGPGGNLQSLEVSWVKGLKKIGLQFERYIHNNDFYYYAFYDSYDFRRHWVDLSIAANGEWTYKNLLFNAKIAGIKSFNYQWYLKQNPGDPIFVNGINAFNIQLQAGVTYRF
ncbi:MAG TPA: capsule assembly Wzi family protein [Mucilaginibacter sp.]|nr:capsule assembly Wzi family protein [Mucilaginibacter sp.]